MENHDLLLTSTTKKDKTARHCYIKKLVSERRILNQKDLCTQLNQDGFKCGLETLKKDLDTLNIFYNKELRQYCFASDTTQSTSTTLTKLKIDATLLDVIKICKIGTSGSYKLFPPFHYGFNPKITFYLQAVMITCPLNYEELLYNTIARNFTTYGFITAQVNKGSVLFIFESSDQKDFTKAQAFYNDFKQYLYL